MVKVSFSSLILLPLAVGCGGEPSSASIEAPKLEPPIKKGSAEFKAIVEKTKKPGR